MERLKILVLSLCTPQVFESKVSAFHLSLALQFLDGLLVTSLHICSVLELTSTG